MRILVAREFAAGRFEKVAVIRAAADGSRVTVPARHQGQIEAALARETARFFAAEPAAREVVRETAGRVWRITRV